MAKEGGGIRGGGGGGGVGNWSVSTLAPNTFSKNLNYKVSKFYSEYLI